MPQSHLTHGLRAQHGHTARSPSQNPTRTNTQHHCPTRPWPAAQNPSRPQHSPDQSPATGSGTGPPQGLGSPTKADTPLARRTEPKQTQRPQPESKPGHGTPGGHRSTGLDGLPAQDGPTEPNSPAPASHKKRPNSRPRFQSPSSINTARTRVGTPAEGPPQPPDTAQQNPTTGRDTARPAERSRQALFRPTLPRCVQVSARAEIFGSFSSSK